jgi:amino acid transporter
MAFYKKKEEKLKEFRKSSWGTLFFGFFFFVLGFLQFFFTEPKVGISLKFLQPLMLDGSLFLIIGLITTIAGVYRLRNEKKLFEAEISTERKEREDDKLRIRKRYGFKK